MPTAVPCQISVQQTAKIRLEIKQQLRFLFSRRRQNRLCISRRQIDLHEAASISDHHLAEQFLKLTPIARIAGITFRHKLTLKVGLRFQMARLQQSQQTVQFQQIVLHGCRSEQEHMTSLQRINQLPELGGAIATMMSLINNHQIPRRSGDGGRSATGPGKRGRNEDSIVLLPELLPATG